MFDDFRCDFADGNCDVGNHRKPRNDIGIGVANHLRYCRDCGLRPRVPSVAFGLDTTLRVLFLCLRLLSRGCASFGSLFSNRVLPQHQPVWKESNAFARGTLSEGLALSLCR